MVTARQIQQLTRQRLEGTVPSYPEQWLEGPMVRREPPRFAQRRAEWH